jgi:hypothetical protein
LMMVLILVARATVQNFNLLKVLGAQPKPL